MSNMLIQPSADAVAQCLTQPEPRVSAHMMPKKESRSSTQDRFREIYARAAYWRTAILLRDCFGRECPDGILDMRTAQVRSLSAAAAKSLDAFLASEGKRSARRYVPCRRTAFSAARREHLEDAFSCKSRSPRLQTKNDLKRWIKKACRRKSPHTEACKIATKCHLVETRRRAKQTQSQMRSAQRDAKHFGFDSASCRNFTAAGSRCRHIQNRQKLRPSFSPLER